MFAVTRMLVERMTGPMAAAAFMKAAAVLAEARNARGDISALLHVDC